MKKQNDLREELFIVVPFFVFSVIIFLGSFNYRIESSSIPMLIGALAAILTGMRLFHIFFPKSRIGRFGEAGLAGDFDRLQEKLEEQTLKGHYEEKAKLITSKEEIKAFIALIGGALAFFLFGYLIGGFLVIVGTSYYYGFKKKLPLIVSLAVMFVIVYILLIKILDGAMYYGLLIKPILTYFDIDLL